MYQKLEVGCVCFKMDDLGATAGRNSEMMVRIKKLMEKVAKYIQIGLIKNKT